MFYNEFLHAQNLVLNPGFEAYTTCPTGPGFLNATHWNSPSMASPDYFNACDQLSVAGVPLNWFGYQFPHNGNGYVGICTYLPYHLSNYREYIQGELSSPLIAGGCYYFEMYVNSANNVHYVSSDIGVYFSNSLINVNTTPVFSNFIPVINAPSILFPDTTSWTQISGYFTATGGERYFTIGNFKLDDSTSVIINNPNFAIAGDKAYIYIDDVSVVASSPASSILVSICPSELPYTWNGNSYNTGGVYHAIFSNPNGCDSIATLDLHVLPSDSSITNINICSSQLPYLWNGNSYTNTGNYTINLIGTNGCDSITTLNLTVNAIPLVNLGDEKTLCMGEKLRLNVGLPNATYLWQDGSISSFYDVFTTGTYWVKLILNGCENSDTVKIDFKDCDCISSIPNVFTPNGDGINDLWIVSNQYCPAKIILSVFNRYGSLIYHSDNYQNDWKGTYKFKQCPDGTYYYVLRLDYPDKKQQVYKGNVTLIR